MSLILIFQNIGFSQFTANAGLDTTICVTWNTPGTLMLGGNPTASGGTAPYSYTWECNYNYVVGPNTYLLTASDFLSDTTIANPDLILTKNSPVTFFLKVEDNLGQIYLDTVIVSFSIFGTNLSEYDYHILIGDSIEYNFDPNVWGGTPPLTYLWKPNHGLSDSTSYNNFWVTPTISTSYFVTVTDAVGCVVSGTPAFHVYVGFVSLNELDSENLIIYPNPTDRKILLKNEGKNIDQLQIFNQKGELVRIYNNINNLDIDISDLEIGSYTIILKYGENVITKKIIKQ